MLRLLNNTRTKDKIPVKHMLEKYNLLSVNQLAAQIKLQEVWKAVHVDNYGVIMDPYRIHKDTSGRETRPQAGRIFNDTTRLALADNSFHIDAAKLWNAAPYDVITAPTISIAKTAILKHVKHLPI